MFVWVWRNLKWLSKYNSSKKENLNKKELNIFKDSAFFMLEKCRSAFNDDTHVTLIKFD